MSAGINSFWGFSVQVLVMQDTIVDVLGLKMVLSLAAVGCQRSIVYFDTIVVRTLVCHCKTNMQYLVGNYYFH